MVQNENPDLYDKKLADVRKKYSIPFKSLKNKNVSVIEKKSCC